MTINVSRKKVIQYCLLVIISLLFAVILERVYSNFGLIRILIAQNQITDLLSVLTKLDISGMSVNRCILLFLVFCFLGLHFIVTPKKIYKFIFSKRYWIALCVFLFLVLNQYHGSSIGMFNSIIQPGYSSEYSEPVFGESRTIRSDEWLVSTPNRLSASYGDHAYSQYNYLMRATQTPNLIAGRMFFSYATLSNPLTIGTFLFGVGYGQSILWNGTLILTFLVSVEMLLILCKDNKFIASIGAILIVFSSFNMWWSQVNWLLGAQACVVCGYHFIITKKRRYRVLLGIGLAISLAYFITDLYPAWMVPAGYLFLGITIWIIVQHAKRIKELELTDWFILVGAILFSISIVIVYLYYDLDYLNAITATVYPGTRISTGGVSGLNDPTIQKIFAWIISPISDFNRISNPSENSSFVTVFPLAFVLYINWWKKTQKKDTIVIFLLVYSIVLFSYCIIGWPLWLAKITLMTYSPSFRAVDIFSFTQLYLLLCILSRMNSEEKLIKRFSIPISSCLGIFEGICAWKLFQNEGIPQIYFIIVAIVVGLVCFLLVTKRSSPMEDNSMERTALIITAILTLIVGVGVNPLQKGFDVIFEKPLAYEIREITSKNPDGKWLDVSNENVTQQFLLAAGAPTINSTNVIPNIDLWKKLDNEDKYGDIYNRYSHVAVTLIEGKTSFELIQPDFIRINLSFDDLDKLDVSYIFSTTDNPQLDDNYQVIYNDECYIYKIK